jgi:putative DNA primase/helicase
VVTRARQRLPAGAEVRLASVPVDDAATRWPALHGRPDFVTLARDLHAALRRQHGTAARAFLSRIAAEWAGDPVVLGVFIDTLRVAAAGELATAWGILPPTAARSICAIK